MTRSAVRLVSLCLLALTAALAVGAASAQGRGGNPNARGSTEALLPRPQHDRREDHRALSDAVRRVERRTGGQVLSAERVPFDGRDVNRVKVIDSSGRVRVYMDDPASRRPALPERDDD